MEKSARSGILRAFPAGYSNRRKSLFILRSLLKFIFCALALTAVVECALRFGLGLGRPVLVVPDPASEYSLKPDQHLHRFFAHTDVNEYGMRSEAFSAAKSPGTLRILFVGDSLTYGTSRVDQKALFTDILHRELPQVVNKPVDVLNASAGNWAIDNELSFLRSRGTFQSDLIVFVVNDSDFSQPRATIAQFADTLPVHPYATALGEVIERFIWPRLFPSDAGRKLPVNPADEKRIENANLKDLDQLKGLATEAKASLIVVFLPFRGDIPHASATSAQAFQQWAVTRSVPFLDLTASEEGYETSEITIDKGTHFNAKGNRIIADAIEQAWGRLNPVQ